MYTNDPEPIRISDLRHISMTLTGNSGVNGDAVAGRKTENDYLWLKLRPNLVSRVTVKEGDADALIFQELYPGMTKQFPGLPASATIMSISAPLLPDLKSFLQSAGVNFQRLVDCPTLFQPISDEHE